MLLSFMLALALLPAQDRVIWIKKAGGGGGGCAAPSGSAVNALSFDGGGSAAGVYANHDFTDLDATVRSLSVWVKMDAGSTADANIYTEKATGEAPHLMIRFIPVGSPTGWKIRFSWATSGTWWEWDTAADLATNVWYNVVVAMDSSNITVPPTLYVNGAAKSLSLAVSGTGSLNAGVSDVFYGRYEPWQWPPLVGRVSDLALWKNLSLTQTDACDLYRGAKRPNNFGDATTQLYYWNIGVGTPGPSGSEADDSLSPNAANHNLGNGGGNAYTFVFGGGPPIGP